MAMSMADAAHSCWPRASPMTRLYLLAAANCPESRFRTIGGTGNLVMLVAANCPESRFRTIVGSSILVMLAAANCPESRFRTIEGTGD